MAIFDVIFNLFKKKEKCKKEKKWISLIENILEYEEKRTSPLIKMEDIRKDMKALFNFFNPFIYEKILRRHSIIDQEEKFVRELTILALFDIENNEAAKRYYRQLLKRFLKKYEKTKAIQLFKDYSKFLVIPKDKKDLLYDLLKLEGHIIASWIALSGEECKDVVNNIKKMLKASHDKELNKQFEAVLELSEQYKKLMYLAKMRNFEDTKVIKNGPV